MAPAERTCERCHKPYRGNSRATHQVCPDCRGTCGTCGRDKNPADRHTDCYVCRSAGKICTSCQQNPTYSNRPVCWSCHNADGIASAQARDRIYGLAPGQYDQLLALQGGTCAISKQPETAVSKKAGTTFPLAVDHDRSCCPGNRSCGECVRGLVTRNINVGLGMFNDDPVLLRAAADYIERHRAKPV